VHDYGRGVEGGNMEGGSMADGCDCYCNFHRGHWVE
jgi:hypothetical protein